VPRTEIQAQSAPQRQEQGSSFSCGRLQYGSGRDLQAGMHGNRHNGPFRQWVIKPGTILGGKNGGRHQRWDDIGEQGPPVLPPQPSA